MIKRPVGAAAFQFGPQDGCAPDCFRQLAEALIKRRAFPLGDAQRLPRCCGIPFGGVEYILRNFVAVEFSCQDLDALVG